MECVSYPFLMFWSTDSQTTHWHMSYIGKPPTWTDTCRQSQTIHWLTKGPSSPPWCTKWKISVMTQTRPQNFNMLSLLSDPVATPCRISTEQQNPDLLREVPRIKCNTGHNFHIFKGLCLHLQASESCHWCSSGWCACHWAQDMQVQTWLRRMDF
jgi:hypothetical protein